MPDIHIYYASICGLCTQALEYFRSRNLTFTALAVEWNSVADTFVDSENTREMYRRCGEVVDFVPQIFVGDLHIRGWGEMEPMIQSGEMDVILSQNLSEVS